MRRSQLERVDAERHARQSVGAELEGRDAAVHRRAIVLEAGRHLDRLGLDVHRGDQERLGIRRRARPAGERAADGDVQCRRAGDAGAGRRLAARADDDPLDGERVGQRRQERECLVRLQLRARRQRDAEAGVFRHDLDALVVAAIELHVRAEADGGVERLRTIVKEIERPDVDRAAGEIDSCRCGRGDVHGTL